MVKINRGCLRTPHSELGIYNLVSLIMSFQPEASGGFSYSAGLTYYAGLSGVRETEPPAGVHWSACGGSRAEGTPDGPPHTPPTVNLSGTVI